MSYGVQVLFFAIALITPIASVIDSDNTTNLISNFLQNFIAPYLATAKRPHKSDNSTNHTGSDVKNNAISTTIRGKVTELKPYLQDTDEFHETDDKLTLRGINETTLIEFLPRVLKNSNELTNKSTIIKSKDPLQVSINKYKKIREEIKTLLDEEHITEKSKTLIITTLDEMIARMIESQCTWTADRRFLEGTNETSNIISKVNSMSKKQWRKLKRQYLEYLQKKKDKENDFMAQFHQFFSNVIHDTDNLSNRYKVQCELIEMKDKHKSKDITLREKQTDKSVCENFKICSEELREFFHDFYHYLNDTSVSVFKNYASMYVRDVNNDFGVNRDIVTELINGLGDTAEEKVHYLYKSELKKFYLDPTKEKTTNIKHINNFITTTISNMKTALKGELITQLSMMRTKLFLTLKEDLLVNLEVDLDNLERHYIDTICATFILCNGRLPNRRMEGPWTFRPKANNELFVKVQLSFDDELKNAVADTGLLPFLKKSNHLKFKVAKNGRHLPRAYSFATINVTRTTLRVSDIKRTGKHMHKHHAIKNIRRSGQSKLLENATQNRAPLGLSKENEVVIT